MASNAAARLAALSNTLSDMETALVKTASKIVTDELRTQADRSTGGDGRLSGFKAKGAYLDSQTRPIANGVRITPASRTYGQWLIVEAGAKPHDVTSKLSKLSGKGASNRRRSRQFFQAYGTKGVGVYSDAKPLRTPWGPRYRLTKPVRSAAKRTWTKAADRSHDAAVKAVQTQFQKAVTRG